MWWKSRSHLVLKNWHAYVKKERSCMLDTMCRRMYASITEYKEEYPPQWRVKGICLWRGYFNTELIASCPKMFGIGHFRQAEHCSWWLQLPLSHNKQEVSAGWKSGILCGVHYLLFFRCLNDYLIKLTRSFCLRATPSPWKNHNDCMKAGRKPQQVVAVVYVRHHIT